MPAFDDDTLATVNRSAATIDIIEQAGDLSAIDEAAVKSYQDSAERIVALVEGGLPAFDDDTLATVNRSAATIDIIEQAGDLSAIDEAAVQSYQESAERIVALVEGGLPAFDDDTLATVNRSAATIDIIEQAGDLSGIDEAAVKSYQDSAERIVALVEGGLPAFDDDTLATVNRSAATIDIIEEAGDLSAIDEAAVKSYQDSAEKIETLVNGGLPVFDSATLANVSNRAVATIDIIEQAGDVSGINETTIQSYQESAAQIVALVNGGLPAFDDNTLDVVNRSAATIDIIEQAGDLSGIDEAAIQSYQDSATRIETLIDGGLPAFDDDTLATVTRSAATIDIIEQAGDLSALIRLPCSPTRTPRQESSRL